jgi:hypothetical protein
VKKLTDLAILLGCITTVICFSSTIRYFKWRDSREVTDRVTELELENEVLSNENDKLLNQLKHYHSSVISEINEKGC